jgi:uncharacterized protein YndB with AHSA1/START domain
MTSSSTTVVKVRAPLQKVWAALTEPEQVAKWFFGTRLDTSWRVGSPLFFRGEWEGKPYEDRGTVKSFDPPRALSYDYWSSWSGTEDVPEKRQLVTFELREAPGGVEVTVTQSNVDTQERAEHSASNWESVLGGLKRLLER